MFSMLSAIPTSAYLYGCLMAVAFMVSLTLFWFNRSRAAVPDENFLDLSLIIVIFSVIGARVLYILLYPAQFSSWRDYLALHEGGLVFYGGFIAAIVGVIAYCFWKKINIPQILDAFAPSMAVGHAIGRLGCYANDCCYGTTTKAWEFYHLPFDHEGVFRHPTQLYESGYLWLLAITLQFLFLKTYPRRSFRSGFIAYIYLSSYTFFRFLIEFIRGDDRGGVFSTMHLSISQILSLIIFIVSIIFATRSYFRTDKTRNNPNE